MKNLVVLLLLVSTVSFTSCKSKYPNLDNGLYAEFVTNKGIFVAKLYNEATPLTTANFVELAEGKHQMVDSAFRGKPFYNNLTFHRVMKDFMIQGGDHKGDGTGNPGYRFPDEFVDSLKHSKKGLLSMANSGPATNGSQFFVTLKETPWLDGKHTVFGEIVLGQEIVDSIGSTEVSQPGNRPVTPVVIEAVNIINKSATVPSFTAEMENVEKAKKEKTEALAAIASEKAAELAALKTEATTTDTGLQIHWSKKGGAAKPANGSKVKMNYAGYFTDGRLLDTSIMETAKLYGMFDQQRLARGMYGPTPMDYSSEARLIPGFREGMLAMAPGDKVTIFIPGHLAYGEQGAPRAGIGPNEDLIFELEMTEVVNE